MPTPTWPGRGNSHRYPSSSGAKRTTISESPRANHPAAIISRDGGVGDKSVRRTRLPAPSAPTTTSKVSSRPWDVRTRPEASTAVTRSATWMAPPSTARRSSQASKARRDAIATGCASATSTESPAPESKRHRSSRRTGRGSPAGAAGRSRSAFAVSPPPHGFSRGWDASNTTTRAPSPARRKAARAPAGPAPTTATFMSRV
jgi:hypothetical protein